MSEEKRGPSEPPERLSGRLIVNPQKPTVGEKRLAETFSAMQPKPPLEIVDAGELFKRPSSPPTHPPEALVPPPSSMPETLPPSKEARKQAKKEFLAKSSVDPDLDSSKFYGKRTFGERVQDFFWELRWRIGKALGKKEKTVSMSSPSPSYPEPSSPPESLLVKTEPEAPVSPSPHPSRRD